MVTKSIIQLLSSESNESRRHSNVSYSLGKHFLKEEEEVIKNEKRKSKEW